MEKNIETGSDPRLQSSAPLELVEDEDSQYGHLIQHLIKQDTDSRDTNQWTGVFTRDSLNGRLVPNKLLGPDLIYDKSLRGSL